MLEMQIEPYFISTGDQFQWYRNGIPIAGDTSIFTIKKMLI